MSRISFSEPTGLEDIARNFAQRVALNTGTLAGKWLMLNYLRSLINRDLTPEQIAENLLKPSESQNKSPYQTMLKQLDGSEINFIEKTNDLYPNSYIGYIDIDFLKTSLHQVLDQMNAISKYNDAKYEPLKTNIISTTHQLNNMQKALSITNDFFAGAIEPYKNTYDLILAGTPDDDIIKSLVNPPLTKRPIKDLYLAAEEHLESFISRLDTLNQQQYTETGFEFFRERNQKIITSLQSILNSLRSSPELNRVKREKQRKNN